MIKQFFLFGSKLVREFLEILRHSSEIRIIGHNQQQLRNSGEEREREICLLAINDKQRGHNKMELNCLKYVFRKLFELGIAVS